MWMEEYEKAAVNPMNGEKITATRKRIHVEYDLPIGEEYGRIVRGFVS